MRKMVKADGATVNGEILFRHVRLIRRCLSDPAFRTDKVLLHFQSSPYSEWFRWSLSARIQIDRQYMRIKVPLAQPLLNSTHAWTVFTTSGLYSARASILPAMSALRHRLQ